MIYLPRDASRLRQREAERARENRTEVVKALSQGQITRRELYKWGLFGTAGALLLKNGFSPFAPSAFAGVPTGAPRSPLFGATKFRFELKRLNLQTPQPMTRAPSIDGQPEFGDAAFPAALNERQAKRLSYHDNFTANRAGQQFQNPFTNRGPAEGRPPTEAFAHQRWAEFFPEVGYVMSWAQIAPNSRFYDDPAFPAQQAASLWTFTGGQAAFGSQSGVLQPFLIQARYGEPVLFRVYNMLPDDPTVNNGFGRNESQLHVQNAHNGAESDGGANAHHFPGTFYDYRWSTTLARRDKINTNATDPRASSPDDNGGLVNVAGDWREIGGTEGGHDLRFGFSAQNTYKGAFGMVTYYSGRDRGNELLNDGINLRLPSGRFRPRGWGNIDFDVNLTIRDVAWNRNGQLIYDLFTTEGFLGDVVLVNEQYAPFMKVLQRRYRFRIYAPGPSRMYRLQVSSKGSPVPFQIIAADGNLLVNPVKASMLPVQAPGERYDIVVDFSQFPIGSTVELVNVLLHDNGLMPRGTVPLAQALAGKTSDPAVGSILQFRIVDAVQSVDDPTVTLSNAVPDLSQVPAVLTEQIPVVTPDRTRVIRLDRADEPETMSCTPDCDSPFPWVVGVNGGATRNFDPNRVSLLYAQPGAIEQWTLVVNGGGWCHPFHIANEEGVTVARNNQAITDPTEKLVRKDVWRVGPAGTVTVQIQFGEYGGAYAMHSNNLVHADFGLGLRLQVENGFAGSPQAGITNTPVPSRDGVTFTIPTVLPESA
jgi:manganese oxidase